VVDAALHDERTRSATSRLARGAYTELKTTTSDAAGHVVEPHEHHRLALLRRQLLELPDDPADGDDLAVAPLLELREAAVALAPQLVRDGRERVLGDVEPERSFSSRS
jgi:hypothetical protein